MIKVSASVLTADLSALGEQVNRVNKAGADMLHIDVMDGLFVPPMTIGDVVVKALRNNAVSGNLPFDTHLMVTQPQKRIKNFADAGSDIITVHVECDGNGCDIKQTLVQIKELGVKAGLAVNPTTPIETVYPFIQDVSVFVIMSVNPGYGGQPFIPETLGKISALRNELLCRNSSALIEVDGGINAITAPGAVKAGADILVAGNYLFTADDMRKATDALRRCVSDASHASHAS